MKAALILLMELQDVDNELQVIEALKGDLPQQVNALKKELEQTKANIDNLKRELGEAKKSRLHWEGEVKVLQQKLKKYQNQLYEVKTNKEYDAITTEIDDTIERIDEAETKVLEFLESEEQFDKEIGNLESQIEFLGEDLQRKEKELEAKIQKTETESSILEKKRQELIKNIKKPLLYQYERIRRVKGNTAIVNINKYACGGCFSAIPPQKAMEIRTMEHLIFCESCGRILVCKNENVAVA
ncbi:MAG: zinc ribbon domain-containing protein [bacterium]